MQIQDLRGELPIHKTRKYKRRNMKRANKIVFHCTDGNATVQQVARYDVTPHPDNHISPRGCPECTYHYFVDPDGTVFHCVDDNKIAWHAGNHNGSSIGISMRYKATGNNQGPPAKQLKSIYVLFTELCLKYGIDPDNIKGHRELYGTGYKIVNGVKKLRKTCPGMLVNLDKTRYIVSLSIQKILAACDLYTGEIDGIFGRKSEAALKEYVRREG